MITTTTTKTKVKIDKFKIKLVLGDEEQTVEAENLIDAICKLKAPDFIKHRGLMTVSYKDKTTVRGLNILKVKMLFNPRHFYKEILAKNIMTFLK